MVSVLAGYVILGQDLAKWALDNDSSGLLQPDMPEKRLVHAAVARASRQLWAHPLLVHIELLFLSGDDGRDYDHSYIFVTGGYKCHGFMTPPPIPSDPVANPTEVDIGNALRELGFNRNISNFYRPPHPPIQRFPRIPNEVMPFFSLSTIPVEILRYILSFACTDAGHTGCTVNLVCNLFRQLCLETGVDLQCALVVGSGKQAQFLEMLYTRERQKRRVVSLFISYEDGRPTGDWQRSRIPFRITQDILEAISPDYLRTLYIEWPWGDTAPFLPTTFRSLSQMYFRGCFDPSFAQSGSAPHLKILHVQIYFTNLPDDFEEQLTLVCPRLTHLRICACPYDNNYEPVLRLAHSHCKIRRPLLDIVKEFQDMGLPHSSASDERLRIAPSSSISSLQKLVITFLQLHVTGGWVTNSTTENHDLRVLMFHCLAREVDPGVPDCIVDGEPTPELIRVESEGRELVLLPALGIRHVENVKDVMLEESRDMRGEWLQLGDGEAAEGAWWRD
ncbi:hypothetical protein EIP91_010242 [Steccherinum ochraceum]|uniref:F-box domain-containing protein n=1 Tax=Steccherinum ochraceum TaxID=92696 RepID=A0A4R0R8S5_9APHY|nr:hypothetical protein EIP91_010242 [Steccherinum ochraceum]